MKCSLPSSYSARASSCNAITFPQSPSSYRVLSPPAVMSSLSLSPPPLTECSRLQL